MDDLELAKKFLAQSEASIVIVKDGEVRFIKEGGGVRPLFDLVMNHCADMRGTTVADKLTGQAAARMYIEAEIKQVFAYTMSIKACQMLDEAKITYQYLQQVDRIMNRTRDDLCPMEKIAIASPTIEALLQNIQAFFEKVGDRVS